MNRGILGLTIALAVGPAHADGVPLLTATVAPPKRSADRQSGIDAASKRGESGGAITHVKVNQFALDSRVITVQLEGKEHRFVGALTGPMNVTTYVSDGKKVVDTSDHWLGGLDGPYKDGANSMSLHRHNGREVTGTIYVRGQRYELMPGGALMKAQPATVTVPR